MYSESSISFMYVLIGQKNKVQGFIAQCPLWDQEKFVQVEFVISKDKAVESSK